MPTTSYNVTTYLTARLSQLGVRQLFSVPGDYTSEFLEIVDNDGSVQRIGNCNELNAGYSADGYARANGLGAVAITNGVGACSVLNAIAGAFVEMHPVVLIIGTISRQKLLKESVLGVLFHHCTPGGADLNATILRDVTVDYEYIDNPLTAPQQIDRALVACLSKSQPVAIEIMEDCYAMPCPAPTGTLAAVPLFTPISTLQGMNDLYAQAIVNALNGAVDRTYALLKAAQNPVLWLGHEVAIYGVEAQALQLLQLLNVPWVDSLLGKAVIAETTPGFLGTYDGAFVSGLASGAITNSDCFVGLGVWATDLNEIMPPPSTPTLPHVWAMRNVVRIAGGQTFVEVSLTDFLNQLIAKITANPIAKTAPLPIPPLPPPIPADPTARMTSDFFTAQLNAFLSPVHLVVADIGLSTFGVSAQLTIPRQGGFLCQAIWAAIGWSVPAALGASFTTGCRPLVIVGDGALALTCQEISTLFSTNSNAVLFILANGVYGVEQMLDNASVYKNQTAFEAANVLPAWDYASLLKGFTNGAANALSATVNTVGDLQSALTLIDSNPSSLIVVTINLNQYDYPGGWSAWVNKN